MWPPVGSPLKSKLMSMYLPKRLELSLRLVLALPKASRTQLDFSSTFFTLHSTAQHGMKVWHSMAQHPSSEADGCRMRHLYVHGFPQVPISPPMGTMPPKGHPE